MSEPILPIEPRAYHIMREVEDAHWWFDGMEHITRGLLKPVVGQGSVILDAGCGTGRNLRFLARYGTVTGMDFSTVALGCCRGRGFERLVCGSVNALPFPEAAFDLVTSFDVLTSQGVNDRAALPEAARVLRPGGHFLVRVAAYDWLRSRHDLEWAITHRYHRAELCTKVAAAGFEVRRASYANTFLFPAALLKRWSERWFPPRAGESDLQIGARPSLGAKIFRTLLASEAPFVAGSGLPFGLSLIVLARKRGS